MTPTAIVAYLTLFVTVGVVFLFVALLLGRLLRPCAPSSAKLETYECGEPPVGTSFVQYDLRFYVVALLFIVFEVELAFFFPPAVVFGKLTQIMSLSFGSSAPATKAAQNAKQKELNRAVVEIYRQLGVDHLFPISPHPSPLPDHYVVPGEGTNARGTEQQRTFLPDEQRQALENQIRNLALAAMIDLGVFFAVLMVGFAYLWKRGDLDWVRAIKGFRVQGRMRDEG